MQKRSSIWLQAWLALGVVLSAVGWAPAEQATNVFVMVSDGASFGAWDAADLYQYGRRASSPYFGPEFEKYLMTTYPFGGQYAPEQAWGRESYLDTSTSCWNFSWGFRSRHPGGVNFVLVDGSTRFISEAIDHANVFQALGSRRSDVIGQY